MGTSERAQLTTYFHPPCCCGSVTQSCPTTLCNPTNCSTPGFPVLYLLLGLAQTHVHWFGDAIPPFHPLTSPLPPAFNLSQIRVFSSELALGSLHEVAKVFSFGISPSNEYSRLIGLISLQSKWLSRVFSNTTVQKHQFFGTQLSL